MAEEWRRIVATLADPYRRQVYAEVVLGAAPESSTTKRTKALDALVAARLIVSSGDGYIATSDAFAELLAAEPSVTRTGVDRFVRNGRIQQYPVKAGDRLEVLAWARDRVLPDEQEVSERELGERLAALVDDVATLRRYLVDASLIKRDPNGAKYWRAPSPG